MTSRINEYQFSRIIRDLFRHQLESSIAWPHDVMLDYIVTEQDPMLFSSEAHVKLILSNGQTFAIIVRETTNEIKS